MQKILIIEDDEKLRCELETFLNKNGAYNDGGCASHIHAGLGIIGNDADKWKLFLKLW